MSQPRSNRNKKHSTKIGQPPGTAIYTGSRSAELSHVTLLNYNAEKVLQDCAIPAINVVGDFKNTDSVTWLNIDGLHDAELIAEAGAYFGLHPLLIEDIVSTEQRPKADDFGNYIFFTLKALCYDDINECIIAEQISFVLGKQYVVSFQEVADGDIFDTVRERIRTAKGKLRFSEADYLVYRLMDTVVDHYFTIMARIDDRIETLEDEVLLDKNHHDITAEIQTLKKELIFLRKSLTPLRQAIEDVLHSNHELVLPETRDYFRDVHDHTLQVLEEIESSREVLLGVLEMYHTQQSNRMNAIMKVLTIMSSIFIPITFIAGLYGMNFKYMPELEQPFGYFAALFLMASIAVGMGVWFSYKKWV
jgi:magnesium transporter